MILSYHPCFNEAAHFKWARVHLPVAPKCNIQCNYCSRGIDKSSIRPGVCSAILKPNEALEYVRRLVSRDRRLKVVGIAGPGEPLFNKETFITLKNVHAEFPELIKCVATNGLLLPEKICELVELGVRTVTVTVNAVDPEIASKIYEYITLGGKAYREVKAAKTLISRQIKGIELSHKLGVHVKVNTVLIPDINMDHVTEVAKTIARAGATIQNIIPLIPLYRFRRLRPPTCREIRDARARCEKYIEQFRLCKMCRADAYGIPGFESGFQQQLALLECKHPKSSISHGSLFISS